MARLRDGPLLAVEYKGADRVDSDDTREKETIGRLWAGRTDNAFTLITAVRGGLDPTGQMRQAVGRLGA